MGFAATVKNFFGASTKADTTVDPGGQKFEGSIIKGFVPEFLYKPPFGFPRNQDVPLLRKLGKNSYVHSIVSTIATEVSSTKWELRLKDPEGKDQPELKMSIEKFFENPNGNSESFDDLLRSLIRDILELDSGIWIKVFSAGGEFKQLFCRDGGSFLKNPDPHGYLGDRDDIVEGVFFELNNDSGQYELRNQFTTEDSLQGLRTRAAYFQYGWQRAGIPIPFGKREVMWFSQNPLSDSVYGRSPLEILGNVLYTLLYGSAYNLDFYLNNNIPDGVVQLLNANKADIEAFRQRWQSQFAEKDVFDNERKRFFTFPITNSEAKFTPFTVTSKEMEVLEQQKWFFKLVMASFGVTPSEMGFTEDSNKATEIVQSSSFKRKAVTPLLKKIAYQINMQLMPELDPQGVYEFCFDDYDVNEDLKKHQLWQMQITMGVKSAEMVAEELGVDLDRLKKDKQAALEEQQALMGDNFVGDDEEPEDDQPPSEKKPEKKSTVVDEDLGLEDYMKQVNKQILELTDNITFEQSESQVSKV